MLKYYKPKIKYLQDGGTPAVTEVTDSNSGFNPNDPLSLAKKMGEKAANITTLVSGVADKALDFATQAASASLGIKNDGADAAVQAASDIAGAFGPIGKAVGAGVKALNFMSKLGGENVRGFEGNTGSSGFRDFTMEDKQQRNGAGLLNPIAAITGMFTKSPAAIAREREVEAQKAAFATAKNLADTEKEQVAARAQRLEDQQLQSAQQLFGGQDYDAILAKRGAKLEMLKYTMQNSIQYDFEKSNNDFLNIFNEINQESQVSFLQNGGSVIPSGALHKEKHDLVNIDPELKGEITLKGIPVITKDEEGNIIQHAEIEREEIIIELSLTKKLEKLWKEGTEEAMIEAGKLLATEIMENTEDNTDVTEKLLKDESRN